jgi:hypothetical protein
LAGKTQRELMGIRFFGEKCMHEVTTALDRYYRQLLKTQV